MIDFHEKAFRPRSLLYAALVHLHVVYGMPVCGRYQAFRTHSMISYKVGNRHSSLLPRRETAADGPSFLAVVTA